MESRPVKKFIIRECAWLVLAVAYFGAVFLIIADLIVNS
jgi:hypothetical protein